MADDQSPSLYSKMPCKRFFSKCFSMSNRAACIAPVVPQLVTNPARFTVIRNMFANTIVKSTLKKSPCCGITIKSHGKLNIPTKRLYFSYWNDSPFLPIKLCSILVNNLMEELPKPESWAPALPYAELRCYKVRS